MISGSLKERLRHILHLDETPHQLAKAFATGVFVAFTPFMGLHTLTVLLLAWAFRLNKLVALTGTFVNNPWTIAFVFIGPTWTAVILMRKLGIEVPPLNYDILQAQFMGTLEQYKLWQPIFWKTFLGEFRPYIHAFLIGTTVAGVLASFAAYFMVLMGVKLYRARKASDGKQVR